MNKEKIKTKILDEVRNTEQLIGEYKELTKPIAPDDAIGRISRMDAINNKSVTEASLRQAESKLKSLRQVLGRVGTNDFGVCVKCGKPIPEARLLYRPESLTCVQCAS